MDNCMTPPKVYVCGHTSMVGMVTSSRSSLHAPAQCTPCPLACMSRSKNAPNLLPPPPEHDIMGWLQPAVQPRGNTLCQHAYLYSAQFAASLPASLPLSL